MELLKLGRFNSIILTIAFISFLTESIEKGESGWWIGLLVFNVIGTGYDVYKFNKAIKGDQNG